MDSFWHIAGYKMRESIYQT